MTERILGIPGKARRRRLGLFAPLVLLAVASVMLIAASAAPAVNPIAGDYNIIADQDGANDEPGQKDLTLQGTDSSDLPTEINTLWNWDDTSVGGGNTLDGCALFDSDGDGNANFVFCATAGKVSKQNPTLEIKFDTLYSCGDNRSDRCTQPITVLSESGGTECQLVANSPTNPFTSGNEDTRIFCTVVLSDTGATTAVLLNTCSYPSGEPNSDPSDCVIVPGKASPTLTTTQRLIPNDSATLNNAASGGSAESVTFELYRDGNGDLLCDATDPLVFSQTDSSAQFATNNSGDPAVNSGYSITADGLFFWKVIYSGNDLNNGTTLACGAEKVLVDITQ